MPTEAADRLLAPDAAYPVAARRILRLALGTALSLLFSQLVAWPLSFIAPILTLTILAMPMPAPSLKMGLGLIVALLLPMAAGLGLLFVVEQARWAGILLVALALFYTFLFTARGGSPALGTFMTIGLAVTVTVGSVNSTLLAVLAQALAVGALAGVAFVWVAHALLPDVPATPGARLARPAAPPPETGEPLRRSLRALLVVLPIALVFMFSSSSVAFTPIMIKVASMGQQATLDRSRAMGRSLLASTLWGGLAAIVAWCLLRAWPSLLPYVLLVALGGLLFGPRIFAGAGMHPHADRWSYAYTTMLIILAPAVLDSPNSSGAGAAFSLRLLYFLFIAVYGSVAVAVFDAFCPPGSPENPPRRSG